MSTNSDDDTSATLMMRIHKEPADLRAWDEFVQHYRPMIRAWCLTWGSQASDADDIAQEVLVKLLAAMRKFQYDPSRSFRSWLKTVTQHAWYDLGKTRRHKTGTLEGLIEAIADSRDALADLETRMEDAFEREILELAMRRIEKRVKPATWQAFQLTAIENRPGAEVAKELQMQVAHVFVAKHRVQKMLEEEVELLKKKRV
jgi:RNA polymerase sigma-70 factor (ECF subfamily)